MLDFWRERGATPEEKHQERLNAYLDNALPPAEARRFEEELAADPKLQAEVDRIRALKSQLRAMPQRRVPRTFALDPAVYGKPKAQPLLELYPVLRGATALTAIMLVFTLALSAISWQFAGSGETAMPSAFVTNEETALVAEPLAVEESAELAAGGSPVEGSYPVPAARESLEGEPSTVVESESDAQLLNRDDIPAQPARPDVQSNAVEPEMQAFATGDETLSEESAMIEAEPPAMPLATAEEASTDAAATDLSAWLGYLQIGLLILLVILLLLILLARRQTGRI